MASWGCPHEIDGACQRVNQAPCDPGMRGCVLYGRFVFADPAKNRPAPTRAQPSPLPDPPPASHVSGPAVSEPRPQAVRPPSPSRPRSP